jgi:cytochrome P450
MDAAGKASEDRGKPGLPPGPRFRLPHLVAYFRDPLACYRRLAAEYGDPFTVPFLLGEKMVVTGAPDGIRQIFNAPPDAYDVVHPAGSDFMGPHSVVVIEGAAHRATRAALAPPFQAARQQENASLFRDVALRQAAAWPRATPLVLMDRTRRISLEVILRAVLGIADERRIAALAAAFLDLHGKIGFWVVFVPALRRDFGRFSPWGRFVRARARLHALLDAEIAQARDAPDGARGDALAHMAGLRRGDGAPLLSDAAIRDNLMTILNAGHESTATALAWAVYWVEREPGVKARLLAELAEYAATMEPAVLRRLPYLDAVCRETLRIHPVAVAVARRLRQPMTLRGHALAAGTIVSASIDLAHHDAALYPDPDAFRPERFLDRDYGAAEFLPFGGGRRYCLGAAMGLEEMKVVLATLLARCRFRLLDQGPLKPVWREGTMGPKGGVRVMVEDERH